MGDDHLDEMEDDAFYRRDTFSTMAGTLDHKIDHRQLTQILYQMDKKKKAKEKRQQYIMCSYLKSKGYWRLFLKFIKVSVHTVAVLLLVFAGTITLSNIENPVDDKRTPLRNKTERFHDLSSDIQSIFGIKLNHHQVMALVERTKRFSIEESNDLKSKQNQNRKFVSLKWFYAVTAATTTVGDSKATPKTGTGKLLYVFVVLVGVSLLWSLLYTFGRIIEATINVKLRTVRVKESATWIIKEKTLLEEKILLYWFYSRQLVAFAVSKLYKSLFTCICTGCKRCSHAAEDVFTSVTITIIFFAFLFFGTKYGNILTGEEKTIIDAVYMCVVTFTTVGVRKTSFDLNTEVMFVVWLVLYRLIGFTLLLAIFSSLQTYNINQRKRSRQKKQEQQEAVRRISTCTPVSRSRKVSTVNPPVRRASAYAVTSTEPKVSAAPRPKSSYTPTTRGDTANIIGDSSSGYSKQRQRKISTFSTPENEFPMIGGDGQYLSMSGISD